MCNGGEEGSKGKHEDACVPCQHASKDATGSKRKLHDDLEAFAQDDVYREHVERIIVTAKREARSELSVSKGDWTKHGFADDPRLLDRGGLRDSIQRIHASQLPVADFIARFEAPRVPVIITGLLDDWPAQRLWTVDSLLQDFGEHKFKVGSDDDGYAVRMKLKHYLMYLSHPQHGRDDSPLYIFDGTFADKKSSKGLSSDYRVPPYFQEDLFKHVGERRRPPYRWFVMGPARSGSGLHIDPLATHAWNALVSGHKRWALFPPGVPKEVVLPKEPGLERESASWFTRIYPRTQAPSWPAARPLDVVQAPGETMFVPGGWWHAVLNLDLTIAVTHNYCSSANFDAVWRHTRRGRPKMSLKWLRQLEDAAPELAKRARSAAASGNSDCSSSSSSSSSSDSSSSSSSEEEGEEVDTKRRRLDAAGDGQDVHLDKRACDPSRGDEQDNSHRHPSSGS